MEEWISKLGDYIARDDKDALLEATDSVGDKEIASFIRTIHKDPSRENHDSGRHLAEKLRKEDRNAEADSVELLARPKPAKLAELPERFDPEEKEELINLAFDACKKCSELSGKLGLRACRALFSGILGNGLA